MALPEPYFGLSVRARRTIFAASLLFIAAAFANAGGLLWNILVWIFAALFFLLLVAVLLRLMFPRSLRNWLDLWGGNREPWRTVGAQRIESDD